MARNRIQFQKGVSEARFQALYGDEEKCRALVVAWRWPNGFVCPKCGGVDHCIVGPRKLFQCNACRRQTSPTAGTVFRLDQGAADDLVPRHVPDHADQAGGSLRSSSAAASARRRRRRGRSRPSSPR